MSLSTFISLLIISVAYVSATLSVSMKQLPDEIIRVSVTNNGCQDVKLLKHPNSALRTDLPTNKFTFDSVDGSDLPTFSGVEVNWNPDFAKGIDEAFVTVPAHGSVHFDHDLFAAYTFRASRKWYQKFTVSLTQSSFMTPDAFISFPTPSFTATLSVRKVNRVPQAQFRTAAKGHQCGGIDLDLLHDDAQIASALASNASTYLEGFDTGSIPRYNMWFGEYDINRHSEIYRRFRKLEAVGEVAYACTCDRKDIYAYVYPNDHRHIIYVCPPFWKRPIEGTDSQSGIFIHQASLFVNFGGAKDLASGQDDCKKLAKSDPDSAAKNAGSYQYFAENNPPLK
jgi:peptidyl-Lys metalloendopeptidase